MDARLSKFMNTIVIVLLIFFCIPQTYPIESLSHTSPSFSMVFPWLMLHSMIYPHYVYASYIPVNPWHISIVVCIFLLFFHYCVVCPLTFMIIVCVFYCCFIIVWLFHCFFHLYCWLYSQTYPIPVYSDDITILILVYFHLYWDISIDIPL